MSDLVKGRYVRIARRCLYTGESARAVRNQLSTESGSIMPTPADVGQARFEGAIFKALTRVMAGGRSFLAPDGEWWPLRRLRPTTGMVCLELEDWALERFLYEALPVDLGHSVRGVPGLRVVPSRSHLDLRLAGPGGATSAAVRVLGVCKQRWRASRGMFTSSLDGTPLWRNGRSELHEIEASSERARSREPIALMSALLRRLWLWREASWFSMAVEDDALRLYWRHGPSHSRIARMLEDEVCGLQGMTVASRSLSDNLRGAAIMPSEVDADRKACLFDALAWNRSERVGATALSHGSSAIGSRRHRIGVTDVRQVESGTGAIRALRHQYGAGFSSTDFSRQLVWARHLLDAEATDAVRERLMVAIASLEVLAG